MFNVWSNQINQGSKHYAATDIFRPTIVGKFDYFFTQKEGACSDFFQVLFKIYIEEHHPKTLIPNFEQNGSSGFHTNLKNVFYAIPYKNVNVHIW